MSTPTTATVRIMLVGLGEKLTSEIKKLHTAPEYREFAYDMEKLMEPAEPPPGIILCGMPPEGIAVAEVAQLFRALYSEASIYLIAEVKQSSDRKTLLKNGLNDVFFMPLDNPSLHAALREQIALHGGAEKVFRNVKLLDVTPDTVLEFNTYLYLPANNKHIKYSSAGDPLDESRVQKLKSHSVNSLSVPLDEMKKFYEYTAKTLKSTSANSKLSETERGEKLESSVRELVTGLFSDNATATDSGKKAVNELQGIVKSYITEGMSEKSSWYNRILAISAQSSNAYSHASNTSTYASIFAIALGVGDVEDIALAGLLHDLGLAKVPPEVLNSDPTEWSAADRDVYESHPEYSVQIIKDRKLVVSETVQKIVMQHHEAFNGTGFPRKLLGDRIHIGAQLLAIADAFDEFTAQVPGKPNLSPQQAMKKMLDDTRKDPGKAIFNPELMKKIAALFEVH